MYNDDYDEYDEWDEGEDESASSPLTTFLQDGWIQSVICEVKSGKEATVYSCEGGAASDGGMVAAKVYRPRDKRNFRNDTVYQSGRVITNQRTRRATKNKTSFGREAQFNMWIDHEFSTLCRLHAAGSAVPRPLVCAAGGTLLEYVGEESPRRHSVGGFASNVLLMEYVGDLDGPAPHLNSVALEHEEARQLFNLLISNIELWLAHDLIHGDLSAFNILYWEGEVRVIDFPQAIDPRSNEHARSLLERDVENVARYFARQGLQSRPHELASWLWRRYLRGDLAR